MIGMSFPAFLTLLVLGLISAVVLQFVIRYRTLNGVDGFFSKWVAGWIGGWLGVPVLGHWGILTAGMYLIPALIGAFVAPFMVTALFKASAMSMVPRQTATVPQAGVAPQLGIRKAS